jgi:ABC-type dipeptide/oligopeptide/nickel transport system permease subunit
VSMHRGMTAAMPEAGATDELQPAKEHRSGLQLALLALTKDKLALAGTVVVLLAIGVALGAPWVSPYDPNAADMTVGRLAPPLTPGHLLGTDGQGRDILGRLIWGGRVSLPIAAVPILASSVLGLALGLIAGWLQGPVSAVIMRTLDVIFAFPGVLLAVAVAAIMGPGMMNAMLAMSIVVLPYVARIVYVETVNLRGATFIEAARVCGMTPFAIVLREVLPNVLSPVIVYGTTSLGALVVFAAGLSFLGVGVQPPTADWGIMASNGREVLISAPWVSLVPGTTIVIVAVALNFMGDGLRDALDPRLRTRR